MRVTFTAIIVLCVLVWACRERPFHQVRVENPLYKANTVFTSFENLSSPKFQALRLKYRLDTVFHGEEDEFKRILLLRDWIKKVIAIDNSGEPYPGEGHAERILDAALKGHGFHCGHYMIVQNAVMNSYGYLTRCLGAGEGVPDGLEGHHGVNEIWVNTYQKWVLSDAKYNCHFEKNGIPLSALEVRDEYLKNKAADIMLMKGPQRVPTEFDSEQKRSKELFARIYTWVEWEMSNDRYTRWPDFDSKLNMYEDQYFKDHVWLWDGKPHWASGTEYLNPVTDRDAIEWTPNILSSDVDIEGTKATITLKTTTPNLKSFQMSVSPRERWEDVSGQVHVSLKNGVNKFGFRTLNMAGISGAVHTVVIQN